MLKHRRLNIERLESRLLLAADLAMVEVLFANAIGEVTGTPPVVGEKTYVRAEWTITDLTPADKYFVRFDMDSVAIDSLELNGFVGTNVSQFYYHGGWVALPNASHTITVTVDGADEIVEANESNNSITLSPFVSSLPTSLPAKFITPLQGTQNVDWVVNGYVDVDPRGFFDDPNPLVDYQGNTTTTRDFHNGIDIGLTNFEAQDAGVPVLAAAVGIVTEVQDGRFDRETTLTFGDAGNLVFIDHGNGWQSQYYHLRRDSITVEVGEMVSAGQQLGLVGSSGNSAGPHLHFEVQHNKSPVEPFLAPNDYFVSPLPYVFDPSVSTNLVEFGVTNEPPPFDQFREQVSDVEAFPGNFEGVFAWAIFNSVRAGDTWEAQLFDPGGNLYFDFDAAIFPEDRPIDSVWYNPGVVDGDKPGMWRVDWFYNDVKKGEKFFEVGVSLPEIRVFQDSIYIIDGRKTPIDFGLIDFGQTGPTKTFIVENHGYADLTVGSVQLPAGFTVTESLSTAIAAGTSDTFTVQLDSMSVGEKTGQIVINSNDASEASSAFDIEGLVNSNDADFNNDGATDGADFLAWQRGFGVDSGAQKSDGDATGEGSVDRADLEVWESEFGTELAAASASKPITASHIPAAMEVVLRLEAIDHALENWPGASLPEQYSGVDQPLVEIQAAYPLSESEIVDDNSIRTKYSATGRVPTRADAIVEALIQPLVVDLLYT